MGACGSSAPSGATASTAPAGDTTTAPTITPPTFTNLSPQPFQVALGTSFELVLPANPRGGYSWQAVTPPDPAVLLSIGSTFQALPPSTTTTTLPVTTTLAPPTTAATTTTAASRFTTTTRAAPTTTVAPTTTTTLPPGATASQVLIYAGRAPGTTTITLRYSQPKAGSPVLQILTFTVVVFDPSTTTAPAPPPSTSTTR